MESIETEPSRSTSLTSLVWKDICYSVTSPNGERIDILRGVSGQSQGGRLLAIMGASGSGKTSLLDILCSRKRGGTKNGESNVTGNVFVNGEPRTSTSQPFSYVPQSDFFLIRQLFARLL